MRLASIIFAAAAVCALPSPAAAQAADGEEARVRATVEGFKDALRSGDGDAALALLHADVRIFESGHAETKEEYASGHLAGDMAFLSAVESTTTWSSVDVRADLAVYLSEYETTGTFRDREIDAHGTETMLLVRTANGWKIRHIHWSSR